MKNAIWMDPKMYTLPPRMLFFFFLIANDFYLIHVILMFIA